MVRSDHNPGFFADFSITGPSQIEFVIENRYISS